MTFNCVGRDSKGQLHMKFDRPFTPTERIQLLQRSILVNSLAYYQLDENLLTDFQYDANARQLAELKKSYPDEFERSRYYEYFKDFCSDDDDIHYTSGFDLLHKVEKRDPALYKRLRIDALWALETKRKVGTGGLNEPWAYKE